METFNRFSSFKFRDPTYYVFFGWRKTSSPDRFTACFFKKAWPVIRSDVVHAIQSFFKSSRLLGEVNETIITLVPKMSNPSSMGDYRPISYCNIIYKCITKNLTD